MPPKYFSNSDCESSEEDKPKKEKMDCKKCANEKSCQMCKLKVKSAEDKMRNVSLNLLKSLDSKWIKKESKNEYLQSLVVLISEIHNDI